MKKLIILLVITLSLTSCEKNDSNNENVILTCEIINTLDIDIEVLENNGIVATIDVSEFDIIEPINEITFIYDLPYWAHVFSVKVKPDYVEGKLIAQINENLIKGQSYEIKAILDINNENCSTKSALFESQGSSIIDYQPITCEIFSELFPVINENNEEAKLEILSPYYSFNNQQPFGFEYSVKGYSESNIITCTKKDFGYSGFNTIISEYLICGLLYEIRAFVNIDGKKCYSKEVIYSSNYSGTLPWSAAYSTKWGFDRTYGFSIKGKAYILFQNNSFYEINNESVLKTLKPFPLDGHTGIRYGGFSIGDYGYIKSNESKDLYRYNPETDVWTNLGNTGLDPSTHYFAGQVDGIGYFFNNNASYKYNQSTNTTSLLSKYNETIFINCFQTNSKIYVINTNYEILEFNEVDGSWKTIATFPGNKSDRIVSFVKNNKVIIGLSHRYHSPGRITYYDLYELNFDSMEWKELVSFPFAFRDSYGITGVSSEEFNYIVYRKDSYIMVWEFDYDKIEYK